MRAISWIAVNVFKESVRDRVPYNLALFAVLLIGSSFLLGQLTAGQDVKIIKDLGLAAIAVFGLFIAIFIGIGLVSKEVERRSIYSLLSKPISRPQFIVGKYAGLVLTLAVNVAVMTVALYAVLGYLTYIQTPMARAAWDAPGVDPRLLAAIGLIFVELMIVTAIAVFFSTFSTPLLAAALTFGLFIVGHFNADLKNFDKIVDSRPAVWLARGVYHTAPDFSAFDIKTEVVHGLPVAAGYIGTTAGYGFAYIAALLVVSVVVFSRRDFK
jgi:ABC-type transport system involved in multi-copper enzyme maturation permease subunit